MSQKPVKRVKVDENGRCYSPFGRISLTKKYCLPDCPPGYILDDYNYCRNPVKKPRQKRVYVKGSYKKGMKHSSGADRSCPRTDGKWPEFTRISKNGRFCYLPCAEDKVLDERTNRCLSVYSGIPQLMRKPRRKRSIVRQSASPLRSPMRVQRRGSF